MFYHHDCPDCQIAIPKFEQMACDMQGNESSLQFAVIEVPPYGYAQISNTTVCTLGKLDNSKEWFVSAPVVILLIDEVGKSIYEDSSQLQLESVLRDIGVN